MSEPRAPITKAAAAMPSSAPLAKRVKEFKLIDQTHIHDIVGFVFSSKYYSYQTNSNHSRVANALLLRAATDLFNNDTNPFVYPFDKTNPAENALRFLVNVEEFEGGLCIKNRDGESVPITAMWNQKEFLCAYLTSLLGVYAQLRHENSETRTLIIAETEVDQRIFLGALRKEICLVANALSIKDTVDRMYQEYLQNAAKPDKNKIGVFVDGLLHSLENLLSGDAADDGTELCIPCGSDNHAMYLSIVIKKNTGAQAETQIDIRVDNLGNGQCGGASIHPRDTNGNIFPYPLTTITVGKDYKIPANIAPELKTYLINIFLSRDPTEAIAYTYNDESSPDQVRLPPPRANFLDAYTALPEQTIPNCVVKNFIFGSLQRLAKFGNPQPILQHLLRLAETFLLGPNNSLTLRGSSQDSRRRTLIESYSTQSGHNTHLHHTGLPFSAGRETPPASFAVSSTAIPRAIEDQKDSEDARAVLVERYLK